MNDPYKVLNVSPNASDDEVKQAYRQLAKRYHPDANPGDKQAEQRMKDINAAYDAIINKKTETASNGYGSYSGNRGYGARGYSGAYGRSYGSRQSGADGENTYIDAALNYIAYRRYAEALNVLQNVPQSERNAKWYYTSALANAGYGNRVTAKQQAERAVQMEPGNAEYRDLLDRLNNNTTTYNQRRTTFGRSSASSSLCLSLCLCSFLNYCCCGRGFFRG